MGLAAERVLAGAGLATIDQGRVREGRAALIAAAGGNVVLDDDPTAMFEAESIRLRAPRAARVRPLAELPHDRRPLITVRSPAALRRQFALHDDP